MNKAVFFRTALFVVLFSAIGAHAQNQTETRNRGSSTEKIGDDRELSSNVIKKNDQPPIFKRQFKAEKSNAETENVSARRQTYLRPTREQRLRRYLSDAFGVPALIGSTFGAIINQIGSDPPEWRKTAGGFGKRFASAYGTNAIRNTVSYGLSETFKLDNRFEKSGQKNFGKRLKHVFLGSYTTRTKTGERIPDFPFVVGTYSAGIIANEVWYPNRYSYKDGLRDGTISLGVRFGVNLLREFIFPK